MTTAAYGFQGPRIEFNGIMGNVNIAGTNRLQSASYLIFAKAQLSNLDGDKQYYSARLTTHNGDNVLDSTTIMLPGSDSNGTYSASICLMARVNQKDIDNGGGLIVLSCNGSHGAADNGYILAIQVDTFIDSVG
jgi:hypothetical protein